MVLPSIRPFDATATAASVTVASTDGARATTGQQNAAVAALHAAIRRGNVAALPAPGSADASLLQEPDADGNTALHHAVLHGGDPAMLDALLRRDADPTVENHAGDTPLHLAFAMRPAAPHVVRVLVQHLARHDDGEARAARAVVAQRNHAGQVPAGLAVGDDASEDALRDLVGDLAGQYRRWLERNDAAGLVHAIESGDTDSVRERLRDKAWLYAPLSGGHGAVAIAAMRGQLDVLRLLLDAPAQTRPGSASQAAARADNDNAEGKGMGMALADLPSFPRGETPLACAAALGQHEAARLLLQAGATVDSCDSTGRTPLMCAAQNGDVAMVRLLRESGARLSLQQAGGFTALAFAAAGLHVQAVAALLEGSRPLDAHEVVDRADIALRTPLLLAAASDELAAAPGTRAEVVRQLLDAGADPDAADVSGMTPLMHAAQSGDDATVRCLLAAGAGVGQRNADGRSAADLARRSGHLALAAALDGY